MEKVLRLTECVKSVFAKFHAGGFSLEDAPWPGRPTEIDSDQIETLIKNNQRYTTQERADILTIFKAIKLLMKHYFTEKNKQTFWPAQYFSIHLWFFLLL